MDANTRFRVSLQMPSIRNVEKRLPLRIDHLDISEFSTIINDTKYGLKILRHYPDGNAPQYIKFENCLGGHLKDFDEFGFPTAPGRNILLPGDVLIEENEFEDRFDTEEAEAWFREELKASEQALEKLIELETRGVTVEDYLDNLEPLHRDEFNLEEHKIRNALKFSEDLPLHIEELKNQLLPIDCRRNNTKPPFTCYIQLTIRKWCGINNTWSEKIQRFEYTKKLFEAPKHFNEVFFGGRTMPIRVGSLNFKFAEGIFRLPVGFRLQVNKVHVTKKSVRNDKLSVLVENSETLDSLWMHYRLTPDDLQSQIVRNAKRLVLADVTKNDMQEMFPTIRDLPHRDMLILPYTLEFGSENCFQIIEAWLSGDRRVGANFSIKIDTDKKARETLKLVQTRNERTKRTKRCVTIRRSDSTKVEVFYVPFEGQVKDYHLYHGNQIMKTRIVKA